MRVLKFGGTSLENSEKFLHVSKIIIEKKKKEQIAVVLSAPANITNILEQSIQENINFKECIAKKKSEKIKNFFLDIIKKISIKINNYPYQKLNKKIQKKCEKLYILLSTIYKFKKYSNKNYINIISLGEKLSILVMNEIIKNLDYETFIINPIKYLITFGKNLNAYIDLKKSKEKIKQLNICENKIILMPGFIAGDKNKNAVILGRNGSDYSAAALSVCLQANICEIWKDVNGIYTCDPNTFKKSILLKHITYQEALLLAKGGAKVIHPKTIKPLKDQKISCIIKNTNNPKYFGTIIDNEIEKNEYDIQGISTINNLSLIKIKHINFLSILKYSKKINNIINEKNFKIFSIKKNYEKSQINLLILHKDLQKILKILKNIFFQEKIEQIIFDIQENYHIISIIGHGLKKKPEIIKKIFKISKKIYSKIFEIKYQPKKIICSIIIRTKNIINVIKKFHNAIYNQKKIINAFLIGSGGVGSEVIKQILQINKIKKNTKKKIKIIYIANSKKYLFNKKEINLENWKKELLNTKNTFSLEKIFKIYKNNNFTYPVFIDCTSNEEIALSYPKIIKNGFNIVTSNKKSNSSCLKYYQEIRKMSFIKNKKFLYETTVGAGLPIIKNLKNLINSGDEIIKFQGILSGSMSYIFGELDKENSISEATKKAKKLGFTEPNPKEDLSGLDVARKLLILLREIGYSSKLSDIKIEKILPEKFKKIENPENFLKKLKKIDNIFLKKIEEAKKEKKVLRYVGTIKKNGVCNIKILKISKKNPLYTVKNGENIFIFYTKYYNPIPLIIRGYGAGNQVTAAGIISDIFNILP